MGKRRGPRSCTQRSTMHTGNVQLDLTRFSTTFFVQYNHKAQNFRMKLVCQQSIDFCCQWKQQKENSPLLRESVLSFIIFRLLLLLSLWFLIQFGFFYSLTIMYRERFHFVYLFGIRLLKSMSWYLLAVLENSQLLSLKILTLSYSKKVMLAQSLSLHLPF